MVETVKINQGKLMLKYGLSTTYPAPAPGILVEPTSTKGLPEVLFVFLGPSKATRANNKLSVDWNPFTLCTSDDQFTQSLTELNKVLMEHSGAFSLNDFYLIDAFPLLYWNGSQTPSAKNYHDHFLYGVEYVKHVISVVKPKYVLSFGSQAAFVVEAAFRELTPLQSNFGTNGNYQHSFCKEVMSHADNTMSTTVYYCMHPSCREKDKMALVNAALTEIDNIVLKQNSLNSV